MRVFLDTNVLASALGTRGLCADVLREVILRHALLTCDEVETELRRTLTGKFGVPATLAREAVEALSGEAERCSSRPLRDADLLVSGDREVRALGRAGEVEVLTPREFWERLRK